MIKRKDDRRDWDRQTQINVVGESERGTVHRRKNGKERNIGNEKCKQKMDKADSRAVFASVFVLYGSGLSLNPAKIIKY